MRLSKENVFAVPKFSKKGHKEGKGKRQDQEAQKESHKAEQVVIPEEQESNSDPPKTAPAHTPRKSLEASPTESQSAPHKAQSQTVTAPKETIKEAKSEKERMLTGRKISGINMAGRDTSAMTSKACAIL